MHHFFSFALCFICSPQDNGNQNHFIGSRKLLLLLILVFVAMIVFIYGFAVMDHSGLSTDLKNRKWSSFQVDIVQKKYFRRRFLRQISKIENIDDILIDPVKGYYPDFRLLQSKVRDKRTKLELSKLEQEYQRCKQEVTNKTECMAAFAKIYKIALDISEKMEKMKEIFQDSEHILQENLQLPSTEAVLNQQTQNAIRLVQCNSPLCSTEQPHSTSKRQNVSESRTLAYSYSPAVTPNPIASTALSTTIASPNNLERFTHRFSNSTCTIQTKYGGNCKISTLLEEEQPELTTALPSITSPLLQDQVPKIDSNLHNNTGKDKKILEMGDKLSKSQLSRIINVSELQNSNITDSELVGSEREVTNVEMNDNFKTICEYITKKHSGDFKNISDFSTPIPNVHFTSRGPANFPVTGETIKATAQFLFNPTFQQPEFSKFCFPALPMNLPISVSPITWSFSGNAGGISAGSVFGPGEPGGNIILVPQNVANIQNNANSFVQEVGVLGSFSNSPYVYLRNPQQQNFFCAYIPNANTQQSGHSQSGFSNLYNRPRNMKQPVDIVYASRFNGPIKLPQRDTFTCSMPGDVPCNEGNQCISETKWCDNTANCLDGSDETSCTCRSRLSIEQICDGYPDCPVGEDEFGCFGCDKPMISCFENVEEYINANHSIVAMCYNAIEKCDGIRNCLNGKDELDCNIIASKSSQKEFISEGFLFHNYKGEWYPVCNSVPNWAAEACEVEGYIDASPVVRTATIPYSGPFIQFTDYGHILFLQSCEKRTKPGDFNAEGIYVQCSPMKCGLSQKNEPGWRLSRRSKRRRRRHTNFTDGERIVGGTFSQPLQWPFVAAIFRSGDFHCGGSIYSEQWIISAAHCFINYQKYYYEVRVGSLRLSSYSPTTQVISVSDVVVHHGYDRSTMKNDIAMLRLVQPLRYNRWVKPICMPSKDRTSTDQHWIWGPHENTMCTTLGWGAIREKGPKSNFLREVNIPVRTNCKDIQDTDHLCAGDMGGGRDACQGDSGGPLYCPSIHNNREWYLAGIVSHGNGCARAGEFGAYTRVALFVNWIELVTNSQYVTPWKPKHFCPGFVCITSGGICIAQRKRCNYNVDCLGGEDEVNCSYNLVPDVASYLNETEEGFTLQPEQFAINNESIAVSEDNESAIEAEVGKNYSGSKESLSNITNGNDILNDKKEPQRFVCRRIVQTIELKNRCDHIFDCEDGSDEDDCSCRDFLKGSAKRLVCDGKIDCDDLTDEYNCGNCEQNQFYCSLSKQCISMLKVCDGLINCENNEDEEGCFALTSDSNILLDKRNQPIFRHYGILSRKHENMWRIVCYEDDPLKFQKPETVSEICSTFGFNGFRGFNVSKAFSNQSWTFNYDNIRTQRATKFTIKKVDYNPETCSAIFIECEPKSNVVIPLKSISAGFKITMQPSNIFSLSPVHYYTEVYTPTKIQPEKEDDVPAVLVGDQLYQAVEELHWPWLVDVYVNGTLLCAGTLVDKHWVLAHESCTAGVNLNQDFVAILLGGGKTRGLLDHNSNTQISRVNCFELLPHTNAVLYYMKDPPYFSRHVLPIFLPNASFPQFKQAPECIAIVHDNERSRVKTLLIRTVTNATSCKYDSKPYFQFLDRSSMPFNHSDIPQHNNKILSNYSSCLQFGNQLKTPNKGSLNRGIIICRRVDTPWYPYAVFEYDNTDCNSFKTPFPVTPLNDSFKAIQSIIDKQTCKNHHESPTCSTVRCPLGECLSPEQVCDAKNDCIDGIDEDKEMCTKHRSECKPYELKCRSNNKCVAKTKFCDHFVDCEDYTDEPTSCSCLTYIKATDPSKLCDGFRNCWDKRDESPALCNCTPLHFPCGSNNGNPSECIPREFVCDNEEDCENGEDEKFCFGIEYPIQNSQNTFGQVIKQSFGIWHTYCVPRDRPPIMAELRQLCRKLGYKAYSHPTYKLIDNLNNNVVTSNHQTTSNGSIEVGKYHNATKIVITSKFSPLHLNKYMTIFLKRSRPIAKVSLWNDTDSVKCLRMEIKCG